MKFNRTDQYGEVAVNLLDRHAWLFSNHWFPGGRSVAAPLSPSRSLQNSRICFLLVVVSSAFRELAWICAAVFSLWILFERLLSAPQCA